LSSYDVTNLLLVLQYEIAAVVDNAVRQYKEETEVGEQSPQGIVDAIRTGIKEQMSKLIQKMNKLTAVANPNFGSEWLKEVASNSRDTFRS